ncbi:MAPEG family protein [Wenzhouxiangella marina]|uniref:Glutathione S-transferase related protein, MAPEG superfamily n=1 Tax=Wenzhouxiangella marina TaxID=1579979 RepID=A0A0K0XT32_9GAMM|nr:MAPEG family protein [Wenzhouxiangella marina]AKS40776.1 Glutathione S-transferase related protein, MAPEG superfamily [Wenzhouxiangella marina]MBB6087649.1 hypothetical protein [Wenzhouxiangella marina]
MTIEYSTRVYWALFTRKCPVALTISLFYAGLLGLILLALSWRVVALRRHHKVGIGAGERSDLELAIRAHANFSEYVPLVLLLLVILEASAAMPALVLHLLGATLVIARLLHGFFGLNRSAGVSQGRFLGTLLTWLVLLASALLAAGVAIARWVLV